MPEPIKVISQNPPGGRCTLYALYAAELESCLGLSKRVIHSDCRDAHGDGFPSLVLKDVVLKPSDGVILSPEDICTGLKNAGIDLSRVPDLVMRLEGIQEQFLEGMA
jgi:cystathionine gamma-synthase